jgi:hypothetical protein
MNQAKTISFFNRILPKFHIISQKINQNTYQSTFKYPSPRNKTNYIMDLNPMFLTVDDILANTSWMALAAARKIRLSTFASFIYACPLAFVPFTCK